MKIKNLQLLANDLCIDINKYIDDPVGLEQEIEDAIDLQRKYYKQCIWDYNLTR